MTIPPVSVLMPSYNQAGFVAQAVDSVLRQSMPNLELIIVDDGSPDDSRARIEAIHDDRIRSFFAPENRGVTEATNHALRLAGGEYVALCNSDDTWAPNKLEIQLAFLQSHPDVGGVFSDVSWLDNDGALLAAGALPPFDGVFRQPNRSRASWMRDLTENGDCLCHPSVLLRRKVYETVGEYNSWLRLLPDFEMHLRILEQFNIFVLPDRLVNVRTHRANVSSLSADNSAQALTEYSLVARQFFRGLSSANFASAFAVFDQRSPVGDMELLIEKARYLVSAAGANGAVLRQFGYELFYEIAATQGGTALLKAKGIDATWFQANFPTSASTPALATLPRANNVQTTRSVDLLRVVGQRLRNRLTIGMPHRR